MTAVAVTGQPTRGGETYGELLEKMRPEILAFCRGRVGVDRAEEVHADVQFAAVRAHQAGKQLSAGWLMVVARNKVVDQWRKTAREDKLIERLKVESAALDSLEEDLHNEEVVATLDNIGPRYRSILVRHYVYGDPLGDLARDEGVSYSAMESAMARARAAFRQNHEVAV